MMHHTSSDNETRYLPPPLAGPDHEQELRDAPLQEQEQQHQSGFGLLPVVQPNSSSTPDDAPEPPIAAVTSDIVHGYASPSLVSLAEQPQRQQRDAERKPKQALRVGSSPSQPRRATNRTTIGGAAATSASPALTPGRAKMEIVLQMSPFKRSLGYERWNHLDEDQEDELLGPSTLNLARKRTLGGSPKNDIRLSHSASPRRAVQLPLTVPDSGHAPVPVKRPRGRPKGWRPGMPSLKSLKLGSSTTAAASVEQKRKHADKDVPKSTGFKRRGRPPRPPSPTPRGVWETMEAPKYVPFRCEWANCKAELQNIDTLRRHVQKVHGQTDPLVCHWANCGKMEAKTAEGEGMLRFKRDHDFYNHMDSRHLLPFVWFVGDGARNTKCMVRPNETEEPEIPKYLLGPDGMQVTPWVKGQQIEDLLTYRENRRRLKEILMQRDTNAPSENGSDDSTES